MGKRLAPFADKYDMVLGWHNPRDGGRPERGRFGRQLQEPVFNVEALQGESRHRSLRRRQQRSVAFIKQYGKDRISHLHLKDRRRNNGPNQPWGQGETPVADVLRLLQKEKYPIYAIIEYEYMGQAPAIQEVKNCVQFIRDTLARS
jgi:hypothetical protein